MANSFIKTIQLLLQYCIISEPVVHTDHMAHGLKLLPFPLPIICHPCDVYVLILIPTDFDKTFFKACINLTSLWP